MTAPPNTPRTLSLEDAMQEAVAHHRAGHLQEAEELYRAILAAQPAHPDANHNLGVVALQSGHPAMGLPYLKAALEANPGNGHYWLSCIEALIQSGQTDTARQVLADGRQHGLQGAETEALAARLATDQLEKPSPQETDALLERFNQGRFAEAAEIAGALTARFPRHGFAWNVLGASLHPLGRIDEALKAMQTAVTLSPEDTHTHYNLGVVLRDRGQLREAETCFRQAIRLKNDHAEAHGNLARLLFASGRMEEAEASALRALQIAPDFAWVQRLLKDIGRELGRLPDHLAPEAFDHANGRLLRRYFPYEAGTFIYSIDVAGTCNLRCPSCPVGNFQDASRPKGFMGLDLFREIVGKIRREHVAARPEVWLFNWGEPLLHPELPEMISMLKQNDIHVMISTSLNIRKNLEEVIRADPDEIKISISGFTQTVYSRTHAKGSIDLVKDNMHLIRQLMSRFNVSTRVWVAHHLYRHNSHETDAIREFCRQLDFEYRPIQAYYQPLEKVVDLIEGKSSARDVDLLENLPMHPLDTLAARRQATHQDFDCELRFNMTTINYDGSVALCCGVYDEQNMLGVNFVDTTHDDIQALKYRHPFCKTCYGHGLQYSYRPVAGV